MLIAFVGVVAMSTPPIHGFGCARSAPFHPSIHSLGNVGYFGQVHASGAWTVTRAIDKLAYQGRNMRHELAQKIAFAHDPGTRLIEIGCGTGTLTYELELMNTFDIVGVDTSNEMLNVARNIVKSPLYCMNGVDIGNLPCKLFKVAVICMVMHELPKTAHEEVIDAALDAVTEDGEVWIVDIDPDYKPSTTMLMGEPYVTDYIKIFDTTVNAKVDGKGMQLHSYALVKGHVRVWLASKRMLSTITE